jgi:hypothetical protein
LPLERAARQEAARWRDPHEPLGAVPERDSLPLERAARQEAARWRDPYEAAGARPAHDDLPLESAARASLAAPPDQDGRREPSLSAERPLSPSGTILPDPLRPGPRRELAAKLSLADLARVRQALALLSDDSATAAERTTGGADGPRLGLRSSPRDLASRAAIPSRNLRRSPARPIRPAACPPPLLRSSIRSRIS